MRTQTDEIENRRSLRSLLNVRNFTLSVLPLHVRVKLMKLVVPSEGSNSVSRFGIVFSSIVLVLALASICFSQDEESSSDGAVAFFNQGQDVHEKGELDTAIVLYEKALEILPEFPEAEYQRGIAYLSLGKVDRAEKSFRRAVELRADWTLALAGLGSVLVQQNQFVEAEKVLSRALMLDDLNFPALSAITDLRLKMKASPEVRRELLAKIKVLTGKANPTASVWAARAALESSLGDKASAKTSSEKALALDPKNQSALLQKAELALDESDLDGAGVFIGSLENIAPKSENVRVLRARMSLESGNAKDALRLLDGIENPSVDVLALRSRIILSTSANAVELEKQLESNGVNPNVLGRLCAIHRIDNPAKALDFCRRASEADRGNVNHAVGYGAALVQAKLFVEAVAWFRRLLAIAPDNSTVHANLATALFQLKRFQEAKSEYLWLIEKQPGLATAYYFLAIVHDRLSEYPDAMANYQQFLRLAHVEKNKLEIEKVNLRLPGLQKQMTGGKGKPNGRQK